MQNSPLRSPVSSHPSQRQPPEGLKLPKTRVLAPSAEEVQWGLRCREFRAYLQPKFDLRTGQVNAVEVLARWHDPRRGVLSPATFIPLMVRENCLDELLFELLEQSLAFQTKLHDQGRLISLAFNLSLGQLTSVMFMERLEIRLRQHPLPLSALTFEITEDGPSDPCATAVEQAIRLNQLGVRLSIDDFGTGYSSLLRLCQVPFSEIKLAGEFTWFLDSPGHYQAVIRNTLALADELGMQLVVEGIETEAQYAHLYEMGVQIGQGFWCAKPMAINVFEEWIRKPRQYIQAHQVGA